VGAGQSNLIEDLISRGFHDLTALDISASALRLARQRLGERASYVHWIAADIADAKLPAAAYDVWHDRALFHFLTRAEQRAAYVRQATNAVRPGGHVIISTFGLEGPQKCSGLDVVRYSAETLHAELGSRFQLVDALTELHDTPFGTTQQFLYGCYRMSS
jgi:SAM-dependent methyltransferase